MNMREDGIEKLEVHVAGMCVKDDEILAARRSPSRDLYPGLWEFGGGQVETGENFEDAIERQIRGEFGVIVEPKEVVETYEIATSSNQEKIPGVRFLCEFEGYVDGEGPQLSEEHSKCGWYSLDELKDLELIPGLLEAAKAALGSK